MPTPKQDLLTAGKIAGTLGIKPAAKKGGCSYYGKDAVAKVKQALK